MRGIKGISYVLGAGLLAILAGCGRSRPRWNFSELGPMPMPLVEEIYPAEAQTPTVEDAKASLQKNVDILNSDLEGLVTGDNPELRVSYFKGVDPDSGIGFERVTIHNPKTGVTASYLDQKNKDNPLDGNLDEVLVQNHDGSRETVTGQFVRDNFQDNYRKAAEQAVKQYADMLSSALKAEGSTISRNGSSGSVVAKDGTRYEYSINRKSNSVTLNVEGPGSKSSSFYVLDDDSENARKLLQPVIEGALKPEEKPQENTEQSYASPERAQSAIGPIGIAAGVLALATLGVISYRSRRKE